MAARTGTAKSGSAFPAARALPPDAAAEKLTEDLHTLMRNAAEHREARTRAAKAEDLASAGRQYEAVIALARAETRKRVRD
jgi:hypothetical protein